MRELADFAEARNSEQFSASRHHDAPDDLMHGYDLDGNVVTSSDFGTLLRLISHESDRCTFQVETRDQEPSAWDAWPYALLADLPVRGVKSLQVAVTFTDGSYLLGRLIGRGPFVVSDGGLAKVRAWQAAKFLDVLPNRIGRRFVMAVVLVSAALYCGASLLKGALGPTIAGFSGIAYTLISVSIGLLLGVGIVWTLSALFMLVGGSRIKVVDDMTPRRELQVAVLTLVVALVTPFIGPILKQ